MRASTTLLTISATTVVLAACAKSKPETTAAPASPDEPTPAQAKALIAAMPAPYNTADLDNGKHKFAQCRSCHIIVQGGGNMTGPNLYGVFGRKAGSVPDFAYSDGMKAAGFTWDTGRLNTWITDPRAMIPGTRMTFYGIKDAKDRIDVIAYLKSQTSPLPK